MRIALYARVSKALEQNPENQLLELRRWAATANHTIDGEYIDEISSKDTRPNKELVLRKLRLGEIDGVAFWSLDRWGRSMSELVLELEEFSKTDKLIMSLKEGIDLTTAAGRMFSNILAAMANYERDRIRERTLLGLARAKAQGKKLGRPFKDGSLNQINYTNPDIKETLRLYKEGKSCREIATILKTSKNRVWSIIKENTPPANIITNSI